MYRYVTNPDSAEWNARKIVRVRLPIVPVTAMKAVFVLFRTREKRTAPGNGKVS